MEPETQPICHICGKITELPDEMLSHIERMGTFTLIHTPMQPMIANELEAQDEPSMGRLINEPLWFLIQDTISYNRRTKKKHFAFSDFTFLRNFISKYKIKISKYIIYFYNFIWHKQFGDEHEYEKTYKTETQWILENSCDTLESFRIHLFEPGYGFKPEIKFDIIKSMFSAFYESTCTYKKLELFTVNLSPRYQTYMNVEMNPTQYSDIADWLIVLKSNTMHVPDNFKGFIYMNDSQYKRLQLYILAIYNLLFKKKRPPTQFRSKYLRTNTPGYLFDKNSQDEKQFTAKLKEMCSNRLHSFQTMNGTHCPTQDSVSNYLWDLRNTRSLKRQDTQAWPPEEARPNRALHHKGPETKK